MKKDYINSIVYNELSDGTKMYYVVKAFDGQNLRIEQLKTQPKYEIDEAVSLQTLRKGRNNIIYYGYGCYDDSIGKSKK